MARRPFISRVAISAAIPLLATFFSAISFSCLGDDTTAAPGQSMAGSGASGSTASSTGAGGAPSGTGGEAGSTVGDGGSAPEDAGMTVDGAGGTGGEPNFDAGPIANPGLWDLVGIARIRAQASQGALKPAYDSVIAEANKSLDVGPFSVMNKTKTPPSGDKHDYMSLARYWWPDPNNPTGPYIQKDGQSNPEIDSSNYDYRSMANMNDAVKALGLAYYLSRDEMYARKAHTLLVTWFLDPATRMNPNFNYAQSVPGVADGRSEGVIDGLQFAKMLDVVELLRGSTAFNAADFMGLATWFSSMRQWLATNMLALKEQSALNNHGSWYDVQAMRYDVFLGRADAVAQTANAAKQKRIASQIGPDGKQPEELRRTNAFFYSWYNLSALFDIATLGSRVGVDLFNYQTADGRSIRKALDFIVSYTPFNATQWAMTGYQQIGPPDITMQPGVLRRAGLLYNQPSYEQKFVTAFASSQAADIIQLVYPK